MWVNGNDQKSLHSSQNSKNLQFPASAHERMEDTQVGDWEIQVGPSL